MKKPTKPKKTVTPKTTTSAAPVQDAPKKTPVAKRKPSVITGRPLTKGAKMKQALADAKASIRKLESLMK
jgi:hypothetical protein